MSNPGLQEHLKNTDFLSGGAELGALMRSMDWSATRLGPVEHWPQSLRTSVSLCLNSRFAIIIWWGPELIMLYNDAYRHMTLASKHPAALGNPGKDCWHEIWDVIGPMLERVLHTGEATWSDDLCLLLERHGYAEETYHTFSYSPIRDESGGVGGVFTPVTETTERVIGERRLRTLRDLAARAIDAQSEPQAWSIAADVLAENSPDIPFAALYRLGGDGEAKMAGCAGLPLGHALLPEAISLNARGSGIAEEVRRVAATGAPVEFRDLDANELVLLPLSQTGQTGPLGVLVAAVSPRKRLDESYRTFLNLVASQIAKGVADAQAYEQERKRAEALAELDRAKTLFFSNVSHEFRTPLTLMLSPLEDLLARSPRELMASREDVELIHRNGVGLLKLVNTLLDFSRIEAGRIDAVYQPTDLATWTAELASVFRSAVEKAGLELVVDCPPLSEPVYVDREMWEKIVLNLLSNALKFTYQGSITVSLKPASEGAVQLTISDTGTGIPEEELPHIFERFHRVRGARGRTHEGTGIGLALVYELARLHGGSVGVASLVDAGTTFTVTIPTGSAHLPPDKIGTARTLGSTALGADAYIEEAMRWLPEPSKTEVSTRTTAFPSDVFVFRAAGNGDNGDARERILIADDNTDMREYLRRLLAEHYEVQVVDNGQRAVEVCLADPPHLVLSDVMMPRLDGFGLLRELRSDPRTATVPVILLSARAGEESRIEGLQAGADDYLIKPFSARELVARIGAHVELARLRKQAAEALRESEERFRTMANASPVLIWQSDAQSDCTYLSKGWLDLTGKTLEQELGRGWLESIHPDDRAQCMGAYLKAFDARTSFTMEYRIRRANGQYRWLLSNGVPRFTESGEFLGYIGSSVDISERKNMEDALRMANRDLEQFAYAVSHDLQEPLRNLTNFTQLLSTMYRQHVDGDADEVFGYIIDGAARMNSLLKDLLAYTHITGEKDDARVLTDCDGVMKGVLKNLSSAVEESQAQITYDPLPAVVASPVHLLQLFQNLVGNAIKYRGEAAPVIQISAVADGGKWVFSVKDNGIGIEPQHTTRIFGLFKRLHGRDRYSGTGLGLAICQKIVERYGGRIWVESEVGMGSTFLFTWPRADRP